MGARSGASKDYLLASHRGATVALHLPSGTYFRLEGSAGEILQAVIDQGPAKAAQSLEARYGIAPERATADVARVLASLHAETAVRTDRVRVPSTRGVLDAVRTWWKLPGADRWAVTRVSALIAVIELLLRARPVDRVAARLGVPLAPGPGRGWDEHVMESLPLTDREHRDMWAVRWVLDRWVFDSTCLRRALAWGWLLRSRRPRLHIGVVDRGDALAHAWISVGTATLDAPDDTAEFTPLA